MSEFNEKKEKISESEDKQKEDAVVNEEESKNKSMKSLNVEELKEIVKEEMKETVNSHVKDQEYLAKAQESFFEIIGMPCTHCDKLRSTFICSNCKVVQYCSQECQKANWIDKNNPLKSHKKACNIMKNGFNSLIQEFHKIDIFADTYREKGNEPCCICFEDVPILEKLQLPCHHIYCMNCISKHFEMNTRLTADNNNRQMEYTFHCPLCRYKLDKTLITYTEWAIQELILQCDYYSNIEDTEKLQYYLQLARLEHSRMLNLIIKCPYLNSYSPISSLLDLRIQLYEGTDYDKVIEKTNELMKEEIIAKYPDFMIETIYCRGVALEKQCKYKDALGVLMTAYRFIQTKNLPFKSIQRKVVNHLVYNAYQLREELILFICAVSGIDLNINFEYIFEFMSKVFKERNDWEHAIQCLKAAVRHECPWYPAHKDRMKEKLATLLKEKEEYEKNQAETQRTLSV